MSGALIRDREGQRCRKGRVGGDMSGKERAFSVHQRAATNSTMEHAKKDTLKQGAQPGEALFESSRQCHSQKLPCKSCSSLKQPSSYSLNSNKRSGNTFTL